MNDDTVKLELKKVPLDEETYDKLKVYTRLHGVKLRLVIDAMIEKILDDQGLSDAIVAEALRKQQQEA